MAPRGSNEVASILMDHIDKKLATNPEIKEIYCYSDNCGGQNKNQNVFSMFYLTAKRKDIKIIHRFKFLFFIFKSLKVTGVCVCMCVCVGVGVGVGVCVYMYVCVCVCRIKTCSIVTDMNFFSLETDSLK